MTQILIVGVDSAIQTQLEKVLGEEGLVVATVAPSLEAILALKERFPAIVIAPYSLANTAPGRTLRDAIHHDPEVFTLLLMVADRRQRAQQTTALEQGADDLLLWPMDPVELKSRVRLALRLWQLTRDLQAQKRLLEAELSEAQTYVRSLLPTDVTDGGVTIRSRFIPSQSLGGDCYDYYWLDPDYLAIYLLDVSGHGLGSALLSTSVLNVLRAQSLPNVNFYRPEKVLAALNETFSMGEQNEKYFTIWYGVYNRASQQLLYSSAGHPPAILITHGPEPQVERLRTRGMPIGMLPEARYSWQRCQVPPGSRIYLFSDGIYEIMQPDQSILGLDRFVELLQAVAPHQTVDDIITQVSQFQGSPTGKPGTFEDDLSILEIHLP